MFRENGGFEFWRWSAEAYLKAMIPKRNSVCNSVANAVHIDGNADLVSFGLI